jgi:predicted nucleic acid-binding protein
MPFVIDNSIVCGWFIQTQASKVGDAVAAALQDDRACAPALWELELTNVLRTACLRQRMTAQQTQATLAQIVSLPIDVDRQPVPASELLSLALRFGLSTYDAARLELALRLQLPLATADGSAARCRAGQRRGDTRRQVGPCREIAAAQR